VSSTPKRSYSVEEFSELINVRLEHLEKKPVARQSYAGVLAVLRQQVDAYRRQKSGK
jgi:hypothetical protein